MSTSLAPEPQRSRPGGLRGRARRHLRARALGGEAAAPAAVRDARRLARGDDGGGARGTAPTSSGVDQGPSRSRRQGGARRDDDRGFQGGAGERRSRSAVRGGIRRFHRLNDAYRAKFGNAVHRLRAAAQQGFDPAPIRASPAKTARTAEPKAALDRDVPHRGAAARPAGRGRRHAQGERARCRPTCSIPMRGHPAAGVAIELLELSDDGDAALASRAPATNRDGRTDQPLIGGRPVPIGRYELRFHVGDYFARAGRAAQRPALPRRGAGAILRSPSRKATITCRCWSRPGAIPLTAAVDDWSAETDRRIGKSGQIA